MAYGDQPQQDQRQLPPPEDQRGYGDDYYPYAGDMWAGKPSNDQALQIREALFTSVDAILKDEFSFEEWKKQRVMILTRASRIPGVDTKTLNRLMRRFKLIVVRAHSQGKTKILRSMVENFEFELEILVSKADLPMAGVSGITAMAASSAKQEQTIRMPQQPQVPAPSFLPWKWKW
jgi:hypothetical protein